MQKKIYTKNDPIIFLKSFAAISESRRTQIFNRTRQCKSGFYNRVVIIHGKVTKKVIFFFR